MPHSKPWARGMRIQWRRGSSVVSMSDGRRIIDDDDDDDDDDVIGGL